MIPRDPWVYAKAVERELGLREGFVASLYGEDDWSFVIKLHALLEAALTHALVQYLKQPALQDIISRTPLSDKATGKIEIAKALRMLDKPTRRFLSCFSELRNSIVHDVSKVEFGFSAWLHAMPPKGLSQTALAVGFWVPAGGVENDGKRWSSVDLFRANPKLMFLFSGLIVLSVIFLNKSIKQVVDLVREEYTRIGIALTRPATSEQSAD